MYIYIYIYIYTTIIYLTQTLHYNAIVDKYNLRLKFFMGNIVFSYIYISCDDNVFTTIRFWNSHQVRSHQLRSPLLFCGVLLCTLTFRVPHFDVRYDFHIKTMFNLYWPPVVCWGYHVLLNYVICVCFRIVVSNKYCIVFSFFFLSSSCCQFLWIVPFW